MHSATEVKKSTARPNLILCKALIQPFVLHRCQSWSTQKEDLNRLLLLGKMVIFNPIQEPNMENGKHE